jgi:ABC-type lipoprotein export system ATPase subunit
MISFINVTKDYRLDEKSVVTPVKKVSLKVNQGDFILIVGRSGSGKTTLLNLAAGLVKPSSGEVRLGEVDLWGMTDREQSSFRNQKIGFVFQFPSLIPSLTVTENVIVPTFFKAKNSSTDAYGGAKKILQNVGLGERFNSYPRQLSSGEQKRVVIARALMNQPSLLLADEPTSDLDEQTEREIMTLFREIQAVGVTIMMVTHNLDLIPYATRALRMERGDLKDISVPQNK